MGDMSRSRALRAVVLVTGMVASACGLDNQVAPGLMGPSGFALSVSMVARPDVLPRDATSQSVVTLTMLDDKRIPVPNRAVTLELLSGPSDTRLSPTQIVTNASGVATFTVTAPGRTTPGASSIVVGATPVGDNSSNAVRRVITIALTGLVNTVAPTPLFTFSPAAPVVQQVITFDASTSTDEGVVCGDKCIYSWTFGDGAAATGRIASHAYATIGSFGVAVTVTDPTGTSTTSAPQLVTVTAAAPVADIKVSPSNTQPRGTVFNFDAGGSTVPAGVTIQSYTWIWGDSTTTVTQSAQTTHAFGTSVPAGPYTVRLIVTDSLGRTATTTASVTVS